MPDHSPHANLKHQVSEVNVIITVFITFIDNQVIVTTIIYAMIASTKIPGVFLFRIPQMSGTSGTGQSIFSSAGQIRNICVPLTSGRSVPALHTVHLCGAKPLHESNQSKDSTNVGPREAAQCHKMTIHKTMYMTIYSLTIFAQPLE